MTLMPDVSHIHFDRRVPDLSVFELAVANAISRQKISTDEDLQEVLSDWFQRKVRVPDVSAALDTMIAKGIVRRGDETLCEYRLTPHGIDAVTSLYGGCIRMIDRGLGLLNVSMILNLLTTTRESDDA
ncbi:hypothetical protein GCM10011349_31930 [Novosphingobium indicum]|jgi:hypothetical protein|uniref:HTH marR-type domain-containing protein n=2 Tax=Novosphingobium TaxID=165696 RepID=A0ABQ2JVJ5_9SPHN|nr:MULTISPECIES: hypothetical protein [Novosphingobium]GGN55364.1 hypothetical protein GCM10011349_31930 [Novosphingobium indicum]